MRYDRCPGGLWLPSEARGLRSVIRPKVRASAGGGGGGGSAIPAYAPAWVSSATLLIDEAFSTPSGSIPAGWTDSSNHGVSWADATPQGSNKSYRTLVSDATAPFSPPNIARQFFLTGMLADSSGSPAAIKQLTSVFKRTFFVLRFRMKTGFEWQAVGGMKLCYLPANQGTSDANYFIFVEGDSFPTNGGTFNLGICSNDGISPPGTYLNRYDRSAIVHVNCGDWVELAVESLNSTAGGFNGAIHSYVNGTDQGENFAVKFATSGQGNIRGINLDSYWGGGGGSAKTQDDHIDYDHFHMWGSNA